MWMKCSQIADEPDRIGPMELPDVGVLMCVFGLVGYKGGIILSAVISVAAGYGIYRLKRGRPYGSLLHRLHALELIPRLRGLLSPRRKRYSPC